MIPAAYLDELKARVSLPELVGKRVRLARNGREFVGLCPFHSEKTPSFNVVPAKGWAHCLIPETPVLLADLHWRAVGELEVGDRLLAFDEFSPGGIGHSRHYKTAEVLAIASDKSMCLEWLLENGRRLVGTPDHLWLTRSQGIAKNVHWRRGDDQKLTSIIDLASREQPEDTWLSGYLAGILDGEGSLVMKAGLERRALLTITQKPGIVWDFVQELLDRWKVRYSISIDSRGIGHLQIGGKDAVMRVLAKTRSPRLMGKWDPDLLGQTRQLFGPREQRIIGRRDVGKQEIIQIQTSTRTFIADGLASHNCFGCGWHGNAIDFVMRVDGVDFFAAVNRLADLAGMRRPDGSQRERPRDNGVPEKSPSQNPGIKPRDAIEHEERVKRAEARAIWLAGAALVPGDPVWRYLAGRAIDLAALGRAPGALRYHPRCWHKKLERHFPAMVAAVSDDSAEAGGHLSTHCTFLEERPDGSVVKIGDRITGGDKKLQRRCYGSYRGGSIKLTRGASGKGWRQAPEGDRLLLGEGIEDVLSGAMLLPACRSAATVSGGNARNIRLPANIHEVILAAQNDERKPGQPDWWALAETHFAGLGASVRVLRPPVFVKDLNELAQWAAKMGRLAEARGWLGGAEDRWGESQHE